MRSGADADFVAFVAARSASLLRIAVLMTGDRTSGEDLVQTALAKAYASWWRLRQPDRAEAYVRKIMVNSLTSWRRRRSFGEVPAATLPDRSVADAAEGVADRAAMGQALGRLSPGQRAVLVLRFYEDLSAWQTAELLGCSVGTVKSQTARGLAALRRALGAEAGDRVGDGA